VAEGAHAHVTTPPDARARFLTDEVKITGRAGGTAVAVAVQPYLYHTSLEGLKEEAKIGYLKAVLGNEDDASYVIDWIENAERYFILPHTVKDKTYKTRKRSIEAGSDKFVLTDSDESSTIPDTGKLCVKLTVGGLALYFCAPMRKPSEKCIKPGFIVYVGTPDEDKRRRIRTCLSYSLGIYLVHLGHTVFDGEWKLISFQALSAYSIEKRVFGIPVMPPAPLARISHTLAG
jgi:hypothetical protein